MPELPEVESIRRSLESLVAGRRIVRAEIVDPRLVQPEPPSAIAGRLAGERIAALGRRGKYLIVELESGRSLVVHLRMTGSLRRLEAGSPADPYRRAWLELDDGSRLDYRYVRRFGTWRLLEAGELEGYLAARVGPEPLAPEFTRELLRERDLLVLTSDHSCDPTTPGSEHTREYELLLAYVEGTNAAGRIHEGEPADVGATVNAWLHGRSPGRSLPGKPIVTS